ncbi:hypothetical protein HPB48_010352 [Haemaphysalis longicornis]|uniref:Uncharacterized protein n=1 Tax=Haemaphysalis longicornis TaxID=44386 RepID=A0A9J6G9M9_HAELO|nr:hypothetical protein HPB48_010352 [Haemaphysalis longicornis]
MLKKRFGDARLLYQEYLARLRIINPIRFSSDRSGLGKLNDHLLVNIRHIKTLGLKRSSFSPMLSDILFRALPHDILFYDHRNRAAETATPQADTIEEVLTYLDHLQKFLSAEQENLKKSNVKSHSGGDTWPENETDKNYLLRDSKIWCVLHRNSAKSGDECAFCKSGGYITVLSCGCTYGEGEKNFLVGEALLSLRAERTTST